MKVGSNRDYIRMINDINQSFNNYIEASLYKKVPLFHTDATNLYETYLSNIPISNGKRQHYTCRACKHFIERYGDLVFINPDGTTQSVVWNLITVTKDLKKSFTKLQNIVNSANVTGVFIPSNRVLGTPITGIWNHLHLTVPHQMVNNSRIKNSNQVEAEYNENYRMVSSAIKDYSPIILEQAIQILETKQLVGSDKLLERVRWFTKIQEEYINTSPNLKSNIIWLQSAIAPTGFCHINSSMVGVLLDHIAKGDDFSIISKSLGIKMSGINYQRPKAAPTTGNIKRAEEIVIKLGIQNSLKRRYARLDEIDAIWKSPSIQIVSGEGVFGHLKPKGRPIKTSTKSRTDLPSTTMTWAKFQRTVLSKINRIEILAPSHSNYAAIVTAEDPYAPPIVKWDSELNRNPFSWYLYHNGSSANQWGLKNNQYYEVPAITLAPQYWFNSKHHDEGNFLIFIISEAKDNNDPGVCLFPEILKPELREVRSTIESYSKTTKISGKNDASACGIIFKDVPNYIWDLNIRVTDKNGQQMKYKIDRWD